MEKRIGLQLRVTQQMIKHKIESDKSKGYLPLNHGQVRLLLYINNHNGPVYQKDIEKYLHIRRSTVTNMLNILERDGYIVRQKTEFDGRLKEIINTQLAKDLIENMDDYLNSLEEDLKRGINKSDLEIFFDVLEKIKANLE